MQKKNKFSSLKNYALDAYKNAIRKIHSPSYENVNQGYSKFFQELMTMIMLHPVKLNESRGILKTALMEKYLKNLGQGTNSLKHLRRQGFTSIRNYKKRPNTHKS